MRGLLIAFLLLAPASSDAADRLPGGPPESYYSGMPNTARVYYKFCLPLWMGCLEKEPAIWGQLCTLDHDREAELIRPSGYRFVSWRCVVNGPVVGKIPTSGKAATR